MNNEISGMKTEKEEEQVLNNNNLSPTSNKKRKRKLSKQRKKMKKKLATQQNDTSLNSNIISELTNSAQDRPEDLQIPSIGKSIGCLKKKLLVLDVNGLLADIVSHPYPKNIKRDAMIAKKAVYKRPFCSEFLNFCFENFDVAVWSSRIEYSSTSTLFYIMSLNSYLVLNLSAFIFQLLPLFSGTYSVSISQCTVTNISTLEDKRKTVVFKDLRKIWDKYDPNLPWEKGYYNESNTLLLDDSPYKGLLNPPYNSIFPHSFTYRKKKDKSLGVGGELRQYLEKLAKVEDMVKYVEKHPHGQKRISETNESWDFYLKILSLVEPKE
ncbi:ubiquitin-like domain-containing CTD phosphatase 1 isoform X2 [Medicago truncatula]|uniref:Mitochondrial import inner membrane translocase subunit TIM50 n=1 Tax=Medicago truncatula TaxID=3880 RepID=A0A072TWX9_MEDTR|nr:ubiquitin-like domain-containing CTD phosphatase 1 isoform X2 [Medicago truncatula]KEH21701.1 NLI interacting factor-like phosphatase [Medicago truncatula]